jgi:hypothetical protein
MSMVKKDNEWAYMRFPEWAWEILSGTLAIDMESSSNSFELQGEITRAFETIEHLNLVSANEVALKPGDMFDIVPTEDGVTVRKRRKKTTK